MIAFEKWLDTFVAVQTSKLLQIARDAAICTILFVVARSTIEITITVFLFWYAWPVLTVDKVAAMKVVHQTMSVG